MKLTDEDVERIREIISSAVMWGIVKAAAFLTIAYALGWGVIFLFLWLRD